MPDDTRHPRRAVHRRGVLAACAGALGTAVVGRARAGASADAQETLSPTGSVPVTGAAEVVVDESGTVAYLAGQDGFAAVDVSDPADPTVLAERRGIEAAEYDGRLFLVRDVSVSGDRLLVAGPDVAASREGQVMGAALFDVSDPANPERVAFRRTEHGVHNCSLDGDTAYLTGTGLRSEPLVVYDVADGFTELARWSVVDEVPAWDDVPMLLRPCHDVVVRDGTAYLSYWEAGTWLVDVSDPADPSPVVQLGGRDPADVAREDPGRFRDLRERPGNSHSAVPHPSGDLLAVGREAWDDGDTDRVGGPGGVELWDVSDPTDPESLLRLAAPAVSRVGDVNRTAHNFAWRGDRLYSAWYSGGVRVYDLADPTDPVVLGEWADPEHTSFWAAVPAAEGFVAASQYDPSVYLEKSREERRGPAESGELYAFPEPSGSATTAAPTGTRTPPPTTTTDAPTSRPTTAPATSTGPTTRTSTAAPTSTTPADGDRTTTGGQAGFGVLAALGGAALAGWRLLDGD